MHYNIILSCILLLSVSFKPKASDLKTYNLNKEKHNLFNLNIDKQTYISVFEVKIDGTWVFKNYKIPVTKILK